MRRGVFVHSMIQNTFLPAIFFLTRVGKMRIATMASMLLTGEPDASDHGRSEILLACRIYIKQYSVPQFSDCNLNRFFHDALATLDKSAYEIRRRGGSGGFPIPDQEFMDYHREFRSCLPVISGAAIHLPMLSGTWMAVYISPYEHSIEDSVTVFPYSPPRKGGQMEPTNTIVNLLQEFFIRMAMVRHLVPSILYCLHSMERIVISPVARDNQMRHILIAKQQSSSIAETLKHMIHQVTYSFVGYTVGSHKDVTHMDCEQEFIECKALLTHPDECIHLDTGVALGRGGRGPGVFTWMIVDHPKNSTS
jgi:hypothetical protein